jgi:hypothetical protein
VDDQYFVQFREVNDVSRPLIEVSVVGPGGSYSLPMLVDTGADNVVLPAWMMHFLQVSEADCLRQRARTIYGSQDGLVSAVEAELSFPDHWEDRSFKSPLVFSAVLDAAGYGLLGRSPTLDHVGLRFGNREGFGFWISFPAPG